MKNFYVETLAECIRRQCQSASTDGSRLQFMVPEISGHDAVLLRDACEDIAVATSRTLVFRVADECRKASDWSESDCNSLSNHFAGGNLTQYRNEIEDGHIIVLLGTDLTTDRGSLEDFYQCSAEALFTETMKKSFSFWVSPWLTSFGVDPTKDWLKAWDEVLGIIADDTSLPYVSQLLGSIHSDTGIGSEQEAMEILLRKFGPNLSSFAKYARKTGKRTFRYYVNAATAFFNYGDFLEESAREKAAKAIDDYEKMDPPPEFETAPFASREEFLSVLRDYILQRDTKRLDDLRKADFLTINDQILKAKPPKSDTSKEPKDTLQKLFGSPLEVLLLGAWRTLAQFTTMTRDGEYAGVLPELIKFEGKHFRHDLPELGTSDEMQDLCREYLQRLLGGLDGMLKRIRIQPNREQSDVAITISSELIPDEISVKSAKSSEPYFEFHITVAGPVGMPQVRRRFALRLPDIHPYRLASDLLEKAHNSIF